MSITMFLITYATLGMIVPAPKTQLGEPRPLYPRYKKVTSGKYLPVKTTFWSFEESSNPWSIIIIYIVRCVKFVQNFYTWGIVGEVRIGSQVHDSVAGNVLPNLTDNTGKWVTCKSRSA